MTDSSNFEAGFRAGTPDHNWPQQLGACVLWPTHEPVRWTRDLAYADEGLRRLIEGDSHLLIVGRDSAGANRKGASEAAGDLIEAANSLRQNFGLDIVDLMPSREVMCDLVMSQPALKLQDVNGKKFSIRAVFIMLGDSGIVLSICAGTAKKLDQNFEQPHAARLGKLLKYRGPGLRVNGIYANRADRVVRGTYAWGEIILPLRHRFQQGEATFVANGSLVTRLDNEYADAVVVMEGSAASLDAETIFRKTSGGRLRYTEEDFVDNRVLYSLGFSVPPGLCTYRVGNRTKLTLDCPEVRPGDKTDEIVKYGLSEVRDDQGNLICQVDNVKFALAHLGREGYGLQEVMKALIERRYSTPGLRDQKGDPAAHYGRLEYFPGADRDWDPTSSWMRSLISNLDFYESGILVRKLNGESRKIKGIFPLDGKWANPKDFTRIRKYLSREPQRPLTAWSYNGLPLTVVAGDLPGEPRAVGYIRGPRDLAERPIRWGIQVGGGIRNQEWTGLGRVPALPDEVLTTMLIEGLVKSSGSLLSSLVRVASDVGTEIEKEIAGLKDALAKAEADKDRIFAKMNSTDDEGNAIFEGSALKRMVLEFNQVEEDAVGLGGEIALAESRLRESAHRPAIDDGAVTRLLLALQDPESSHVHTILKDAIQNLTLTITRAGEGRVDGTRVVMQGELEFFLEGHGTVAVPLSGEYLSANVGSKADRAERGEQALRDGSAALWTRPGDKETKRLGAERLGLPLKMSSFMNGRDPDLLAIAVAALAPPHADSPGPRLEDLLQDVDLQRKFTDVSALAARIAAVAEGNRRSIWLQPDGADYLTEALLWGLTPEMLMPHRVEEVRRKLANQARRSAREKSVAVHYGRWLGLEPSGTPSISPCAYCGSKACAQMRILEVTGYLCLTCRRDEAGVTWPEKFDDYISNLSMWAAAGLVSPRDTPRAARPQPQGSRPILRQAGDLSKEELDDLVRCYLDERPVRHILEAFDISEATYYNLVRPFRGQRTLMAKHRSHRP